MKECTARLAGEFTGISELIRDMANENCRAILKLSEGDYVIIEGEAWVCMSLGNRFAMFYKHRLEFETFKSCDARLTITW